jgi:hypothetical protein
MRIFAFNLPARLRVLTALLMVCCAFSQDSSFTRADFDKVKIIMGTWINKRANGDIYEHWDRNSESELSGISYKLTSSDTVFLEKVRLYYQGKEIIYAPVAYGQNNEKQVLFKLKSIEENRFVFENLLHDFPKRIVYDFRTADSLYAYIEGGNKRINYPYRRIN